MEKVALDVLRIIIANTSQDPLLFLEKFALLLECRSTRFNKNGNWVDDDGIVYMFSPVAHRYHCCEDYRIGFAQAYLNLTKGETIILFDPQATKSRRLELIHKLLIGKRVYENDVKYIDGELYMDNRLVIGSIPVT